MPKALFVLHESALGTCLFEIKGVEEVALKQVQKSVTEYKRFSQICHWRSFLPFTSQDQARDVALAFAENELHEDVANWLLAALPKVKEGKKPKYLLGISDPMLGEVLKSSIGVKGRHDKHIREILRGIRTHLGKYMKTNTNITNTGVLEQAELGLAHSYSRTKVKFNVNRVDNMIIQAICLLDQLDKDINTFTMRIREWYGWHFPELSKLVKDMVVYARVAKHLGNKTKWADNPDLEALEETCCLDADVCQDIVKAAKSSMGTDISELDQINISMFGDRVIKLAEYRKELHHYLCLKMNSCAPNLTALIGELVGARLISHAGSLTKLAKYPASTVQILGAEKALFRALKTKGNTPKYGLIFHSPFIGKAGPKNKGRISRYLANKASLASRIDCFRDEPTDIYGKLFRAQVEERLEFYKSGKTPRKNKEVMAEAKVQLGESAPDKNSKKRKLEEAQATDGGPKKKKKKKKKRKKNDGTAQEASVASETDTPRKKKKKKKKKKKDKATP